MAVVTAKSTQITNRDSVPTVLTNSYIGRSVVKEAYGYVTATNGDSATSVYKMAQVPSNARLSSISVSNDALGTSAAVNVGVYYPTSYPLNQALAGTAISAALFASALSVVSAQSKINATNQSASYTYDKQEMPLWQAAGLASDPECMLDISVAVSVAIAATGKLALNVSYCE